MSKYKVTLRKTQNDPYENIYIPDGMTRGISPLAGVEIKPRGRPRRGDEYPIKHKPPRECHWCGAAENFRSNRSAITIGVVKVEWLRCMACFKVTRFETRVG